MKTVQTKIPDKDTKYDWVKIKCEDVIEMDNDISVLLNWIEELNTKSGSPVTEEVYSAIDDLNSQLESFKRL